MNTPTEAATPPQVNHVPPRRGGRKKGWTYFKTRGEAEAELRTVVNLVKLGQLEPARANSAIYAISTWLGSRKWAAEFERKQLDEELLKRMAEMQQNYAVLAEILDSKGIALPLPRLAAPATSTSNGQLAG
jgi:hypothetical protein